MQLDCPRCGRTIPGGDINVQTSIAKCSACGSVFGFADLVPGAQAAYRKPVVEMPKHFSVAQEGADLLITYRWFSAGFVFLLFFCLFWDGFLAVWYYLAFVKGGPLGMKLFPLIHVAAGIGLTYFTLAGFVNRTIVRASSGELAIRHLPLPWPGNKVLSRADVEQLFCEEKMSRGRNGTSVAYQVSAVMRGGSRVKLVSGLASPEQALFIEEQIEGFFGIKDRPVAGEMRPA